MGTITGFASDIIKQNCPSPYAILKNIIIHSKYDASARHPMIHVIPYIESTVSVLTCPNYLKKWCFYLYVCKTFLWLVLHCFHFCADIP